MKTLRLHKEAEKYLNSLNTKLADRIEEAMENLCRIPPVGDILPLKDRSHFWRMRLGKLRIIYYATDTTVNVVAIGSRGQIYNN